MGLGDNLALEALAEISDAEVDAGLSKMERKVEPSIKKMGKGFAASLFDPKDIHNILGGLVGGQGGGGLTGQLGGMIGEAVAGPLGAAIGGQLGPALEKAAPGAMQNLNIVMDDISATIGNTFIPVLETLTPMLRAGADVLATILPNANEMREALSPLIDSIQETMEAFKKVYAVIGPIIRGGLLLGINLLATAAEIAAKAMMLIQEPVMWLIETIGGATGKGTEGLRSSLGASGQRASFQSIESYSQAIQQAAYGGPVTLAAKVDETNRILTDIRRAVTQPRDVIREIDDREKNRGVVGSMFTTDNVVWGLAQLGRIGQSIGSGPGIRRAHVRSADRKE